jgi:uncharacterized membrane protein YesL
MSDPGSPTRADEETGGRRRPSIVGATAVWLGVVEVLLAVTTVPALVWLVFLDASWSSVPLIVVLGIPVGPAMAAAIFAWRRLAEDRDLAPARHFWRGYRLNWADALRIWVPALVVLVLLGVNLANLREGDAPLAFAVVGLVAAVLVVVWTAHAMVVVSLFSFRTGDVLRIAVFFMLARPVVSLGALVIVALGVAGAWWVGAWLPLAAASVLTYLLRRNAAPIVAEVHRRFVVGAPDAPQAKPWEGLDGVELESGDVDADER